MRRASRSYLGEGPAARYCLDCDEVSATEPIGHGLLRQAGNITRGLPALVIAHCGGCSVMVKWGPPMASFLPRSPSRRWHAVPVPLRAVGACMAFVMMAAAGLLCWRPQVPPPTVDTPDPQLGPPRPSALQTCAARSTSLMEIVACADPAAPRGESEDALVHGHSPR